MQRSGHSCGGGALRGFAGGVGGGKKENHKEQASVNADWLRSYFPHLPLS
jgi:hypothetical protein